MEYLVTGGTGFIGTHVVERLVADGHDVVVVTRSRANANHLPEEVTVFEGDITDKESLREPMQGVDGVFHIAAWFYLGPGPRMRETAERINVEGTRNVLELMAELDVPKGVYTSTVAVFGDTGGQVVDETHRPSDPGLCVYFRTKWRAHYDVAQPMIDEGLPLVIVHPGAVYGPGDKEYGSVRAPFINWLNGDLPMLPREFAMPFDYVEDVAHAHIRAMEAGRPGESYIVSSEPREVVDVFERAAALTGIDAPRSVSPRWFSLLAALLTPVEKLTTTPKGFEPELLRTFAGTQILVDNAKARRELDIEHRPIDDGLRQYLAWELAEQGMDDSVGEEDVREPVTGAP